MIPAPLNWGPLWCGGREAKVMEWVDDAGALHRSFDIPVQPKVTANMVMWLFSPAYPQFIDFGGKRWYWYHLWHPMDHVNAANAGGPSTANPLKPGLYTLIHEHYRNLPEEKAKALPEYETEVWFHVDDLYSNFLKKRIMISINALGMQAWTLIVNLKDTPEGLKIDNELIIGAARTGFDPRDPRRGTPAEAAVVVNDNVLNPALRKFYGTDAEFDRSVNAISRHVVEEFSMFRFFLPQVWAANPSAARMFDAADAVNRYVPRLNYGPGMLLPAPSAAGLTEALAPLNRTAFHDKPAALAALKKAPGALTAGAAAHLGDGLQRLRAAVSGKRLPTDKASLAAAKFPGEAAAGAFDGTVFAPAQQQQQQGN